MLHCQDPSKPLVLAAMRRNGAMMNVFFSRVLVAMSFLMATLAMADTSLHRSFDCVFIGHTRDEDPITREITYGNPFDVRNVKMLDHQSEDEQWMEIRNLRLSDKKSPPVFSSPRKAEDPETSRDDNPRGRNGWGGMMFLKTKEDNGFDSQKLMLVTKATRTQMGEKTRTYSLSFFRNHDLEESSSWFLTGTLVCEQKIGSSLIGLKK